MTSHVWDWSVIPLEQDGEVDQFKHGASQKSENSRTRTCEKIDDIRRYKMIFTEESRLIEQSRVFFKSLTNFGKDLKPNFGKDWKHSRVDCLEQNFSNKNC